MSPTPTQTSATEFDRLVAKMSTLVEAGERVDIAALTADCPQHREQLEMLLPTLEAVVDLEHSSAADTTEASVVPADAVQGVLGDFRIIREIGRGGMGSGMGIVYEAEQISLGRCMALKVLPLAATLNAQQLARFKNEARAAAALNHPHIVGVHSVGAERGVHFYAMELVEGHSLAQLVEGGSRGEGSGSRSGTPARHGNRDGNRDDNSTGKIIEWRIRLVIRRVEVPVLRVRCVRTMSSRRGTASRRPPILGESNAAMMPGCSIPPYGDFVRGIVRLARGAPRRARSGQNTRLATTLR